MTSLAAVPPEPALSRRLHLIDALRGTAVVLMAIYHFAWDLQYLRLVQLYMFTDPWWHRFALFIAGSFLFLTGVSQVLAARNGLHTGRFLKRVGVIAANAAAISIATRIAVPEGWVFFGVLHCIAVSAILGLPFLRLPPLATAAAGVFCLAAPGLFASDAFNAPWLWWLGLATARPGTYDFVPVLPWLGWALLGMATTQLILNGPERARALLSWRPRARAWDGLEWLGRHSLVVYMLHQPILFGSLWGVAQVLR